MKEEKDGDHVDIENTEVNNNVAACDNLKIKRTGWTEAHL